MANRYPSRAFSEHRGAFIEFDEVLGEGGAGAALAIKHDPNCVAKLYKAAKRPENLEDRLALVRKVIKNVDGVCVVQETLYDVPNGEPIGVVLERLHGDTLNNATFKSIEERKQGALSVAITFDELAQRRAYQTDAHYDNQMVIKTDRGCSVVLIDPDGFVIGPQPSRGHAAGFGPAEYCRWEEFTPDARLAGYLLAEMLHRILKDRHPRQAADAAGRVAPVEALINSPLMGRFDPEILDSEGCTAIDDGIAWDKLPYDLRFLFEKTIGEGFDNPHARARPSDFVDVLSNWQDSRRRRVVSLARKYVKKTRWLVAAGCAAGVGAALVRGCGGITPAGPADAFAAVGAARDRPAFPSAFPGGSSRSPIARPYYPGTNWRPR